MKKQVYSQEFRSLNDLIRIVKRAWKDIKLESIRNTIDHVEKRMAKVFNANGDFI